MEESGPGRGIGNVARYDIGCDSGSVQRPTGGQKSGKRHRRERHGDHAEAEVWHQLTGGCVVILIEKAETSCQREERDGNHHAANPPGLSQPVTSYSKHRPHGMHRECQVGVIGAAPSRF